MAYETLKWCSRWYRRHRCGVNVYVEWKKCSQINWCKLVIENVAKILDRRYETLYVVIAAVVGGGVLPRTMDQCPVFRGSMPYGQVVGRLKVYMRWARTPRECPRVVSTLRHTLLWPQLSIGHLFNYTSPTTPQPHTTISVCCCITTFGIVHKGRLLTV